MVNRGDWPEENNMNGGKEVGCPMGRVTCTWAPFGLLKNNLECRDQGNSSPPKRCISEAVLDYLPEEAGISDASSLRAGCT